LFAGYSTHNTVKSDIRSYSFAVAVPCLLIPENCYVHINLQSYGTNRCTMLMLWVSFFFATVISDSFGWAQCVWNVDGKK